jgi:hypothetical protein
MWNAHYVPSSFLVKTSSLGIGFSISQENKNFVDVINPFTQETEFDRSGGGEGRMMHLLIC